MKLTLGQPKEPFIAFKAIKQSAILPFSVERVLKLNVLLLLLLLLLMLFLLLILLLLLFYKEIYNCCYVPTELSK